ncbi:MAG: pitrilysin family protein [Patescibacteria group bacterium]
MFKKHLLKNGVRLITIPLKDVKSVMVLALIKTGSKYETKGINGVSHFLEHMMFKGTKKRPTTLALSTELDSVGAEYNAFTGDERTGYWVKVDCNHLDLALDVVSDVLLNSKLDKKEIERERGVIIEEINMNSDSPMRYIWDLFQDLMYGDQPAGRPITGTKETVAGLKRDDFLDYLKKQYIAKNLIVAVAGNFNDKNILPRIKKYFIKVKLGAPREKQKTVEHQIHPECSVFFKETEQTHFVLGVRAYSVFDKRKYALSLLSSILGGSMSSRLWISIRRKGLAYYVSSIVDATSDVGFLAARAGVNNAKAEEVIKEVLKEFKKIRGKGVSAAELKKAKDYFKGKTLINLEGPEDWVDFAGEQEIALEKVLTPEEILEKINAVSRQDILEVARDIFRPEKLNLAIIGPHKGKAKFEKLLKLW